MTRRPKLVGTVAVVAVPSGAALARRLVGEGAAGVVTGTVGDEIGRLLAELEGGPGRVVGLLPREAPAERRCPTGDLVFAGAQGGPSSERGCAQLGPPRRTDPSASCVRRGRCGWRKMHRCRAHRKRRSASPLGRRCHRLSHCEPAQLGYSARSQ